MNYSKLVGRKVLIRAEEMLSAPCRGVIGAIDSDGGILLYLDPTVQLGADECQHALARVRSVQDSYLSLLSSGILSCNVTFVPVLKFDQTNPFNLSWWRGGGALIADVVLTGE